MGDSYVHLLTTGSGDYGSEWSVIAVFRSEENAKRAKLDYESKPHTRPDGSAYYEYANEIEVMRFED